MDSKEKILLELDSRIARLEIHKDDEKPDYGNPYEKLNHAVSSVIGESLKGELQDLRSFIEEC